MSGRYHKAFFEAPSAQSEIKLRVYQNYLRPWSAKVGSSVSGQEIWVVDGFAGRGRYRNGAPGSPELALQRAEEIAADARNRYRLRAMFGDNKPANVAVLYELRGAYPAANALVIDTDFWIRVPDVVHFVGRQPALVFVDPFGLLGIDFDALSRLASQLPRLDLLINLRSSVAPRLATGYSERVTRAVGSDDWTIETLSDVFRRNLQAVAGFLPPAALPLRDRFHGAVHSELILASRHPDAYELWNDQIVIEAERLLEDSGVINPKSFRNERLEEVVSRINRWAAERRRWTRQEVISWHSVEYCGDVHTGTVREAVKVLLKGPWKRENRTSQIETDTISWA